MGQPQCSQLPVQCVVQRMLNEMNERNAAIKKGVKADDRGCINIPCSYDMAWQKQGKGYN